MRWRLGVASGVSLRRWTGQGGGWLLSIEVRGVGLWDEGKEKQVEHAPAC